MHSEVSAVFRGLDLEADEWANYVKLLLAAQDPGFDSNGRIPIEYTGSVAVLAGVAVAVARAVAGAAVVAALISSSSSRRFPSCAGKKGCAFRAKRTFFWRGVGARATENRPRPRRPRLSALGKRGGFHQQVRLCTFATP